MDPRLLEIQFLMELDRCGHLVVHIASHASNPDIVVLVGDQRRTGPDATRLRDLIVELFVLEHVTVPLPPGVSRKIASRMDQADLAVQKLTSNQPAQMELTHRGRVRLWDLRDELLRDPDIEPMGLRSRAAWDRELPLRLLWATTESPLAMILFDLDHFGLVNKELGMTSGDEVLRAAFDIAKNTVGPRGYVYRYGGEEVGILIPETTLAAAASIAETLRSSFESAIRQRVPALKKPQTASFGVAVFTVSEAVTAVVDRVDALVRRAKSAGRNRVETSGG